jgi:DNA-binding NarL/FixJ family response regulator
MILSSDPEIEVVGEAADGEQAIALSKELRPDVVLMDIRMPEIDGIEATRRIVRDVSPPPRIVILTTFDLDEYVFDAIAAGASGFLLKDAPATQLIAAVQTVVAGDALLAPQITRRLIDEFARARTSRQPHPGFAELTPREREVFELLAEGFSNSEIAGTLVLEETTIKTHVTRILSKLQVRDRVQAVILAYEAGLIAPGRN